MRNFCVNILPERLLSFKTTRCLRQYRKATKSFKRFPELLFNNPSCHTLSKAFDISKRTPHTSSPSLNDLCISMSNSKHLSNTGVTRSKPWLVRRNQVIISKRWLVHYKKDAQNFSCKLKVRKWVYNVLDTAYLLSCEQIQHGPFSNQKEIFSPLYNHQKLSIMICKLNSHTIYSYTEHILTVGFIRV